MFNNRKIISEKIKTFCICGLPFQTITEESIIELIKESSTTGDKLVINTPNLNFLRIADKDINFHNALLRSDILLPDGMPIIWIAKIFNLPINKRIAGASLIARLVSNLSEFPFKVFYFGGAAGVSKKAHRITNSVKGSSRSVGYVDPGFGDLEHLSKEQYLDKINSSRPNVLLVSLPAIKGVSWIEKNYGRLNANIFISSGATVNFISGAIKRSPLILQNLGLEWLWRIKEEPILINRYTLDGLWLIKTLVTKLIPLMIINVIYKSNFLKKDRLIKKDTKPDGTVIYLPEYCDNETIENLIGLINSENSNLTLDFNKIRYANSRFIGEVLFIKNKFSKHNLIIKVANASTNFKILSYLHGVKNFV